MDDLDFLYAIKCKYFLEQRPTHAIFVRESLNNARDLYYPVQKLTFLENTVSLRKLEILNNVSFVGQLGNDKYFNINLVLYNVLGF